MKSKPFSVSFSENEGESASAEGFEFEPKFSLIIVSLKLVNESMEMLTKDKITTEK